jgi:hypothetical protein
MVIGELGGRGTSRRVREVREDFRENFVPQGRAKEPRHSYRVGLSVTSTSPSKELACGLPLPLTPPKQNPGPSTGLGRLFEMPLRKRETGPALEIELESVSQLASLESEVALHLPRPVFRRVRRLPVVVLLQPPLQVIGVPDVAPSRLQALQNVGVKYRRQLARIFGKWPATRSPGPESPPTLAELWGAPPFAPALCARRGEGWWRRGELNPCPKHLPRGHLHV